MKNDSHRVYLKIFVRLFPVFAYFGSAAFSFYIIGKLPLPEIINYIAELVIIFGHLGLLVALFNEYSGQKE